VIDLDDFASVNKSFGPATGNAILVEAAVRLRDGLGRNDTLARIGGDEFVVIVQGAPTEGAVMELADRLLLAGQKPYLIDGAPVRCTMSIGVAMTTNATRRSEELLQEADLALYRAKARGRNRVERFAGTLRPRSEGRLFGEGMLRDALESDQLRLDFQPVVDLATGRTVEADAVLQVISPVGETLPPAAFLPIAEEHGLLGALDDWALRAALDQVQRWPPTLAARGFSGITVNAPAHRLHDDSFTAGLLNELRRRAIPAGSLRLEVNEEVFVESARPTLDALRELRAAGVRVARPSSRTSHRLHQDRQVAGGAAGHLEQRPFLRRRDHQPGPRLGSVRDRRRRRDLTTVGDAALDGMRPSPRIRAGTCRPTGSDRATGPRRCPILIWYARA
jgi:diguanylate cyclase (GGDEF)-like protein